MKKSALFFGMLATALGLWSPVFAADTEADRKILKDAVVGAVTGAVATEATKDEKVSPAPATPPDETPSPRKNFSKKHHGHHHQDGDDDRDHDKDKKRPHGWDMGKKTGWGGKDTPPGLAKKENK